MVLVVSLGLGVLRVLFVVLNTCCVALSFRWLCLSVFLILLERFKVKSSTHLGFSIKNNLQTFFLLPLVF